MGKKVAILTDSNSGITQEQSRALGIPVLPMPFYINEKLFYEDITLTQEQFYQYLETDAEIHTSMPVVGDVLDCWKRLLEDHDEIVYIPMSSGLSSSCATAITLADDLTEEYRLSITSGSPSRSASQYSTLPRSRSRDGTRSRSGNTWRRQSLIPASISTCPL